MALQAPVVRGLNGLPPLYGYNGTEIKDSARAILVTPEHIELARYGGLTICDAQPAARFIATLQPGVRGVEAARGETPLRVHDLEAEPTPNPAVEVREPLPDGTEFKAVWSHLRQSGVAKLVTVHFFDRD